jgi:hypothetical protein
MTRDTGGPAFPVMWHNDAAAPDAGMTLRDYFAATALQGMLSCDFQPQRGADMLAQDAYTMADAMLAERARP